MFVNRERLSRLLLPSLCLLNLLVMHNYLLITCQVEDAVDWTSWIDNVAWSIVDVWVLYTLALLLFKGKRIATAIVFVITLLWSFCNVLYSRFFYHYISWSAISEVGSIADPLVLDSSLAGLRWMDLYYVFVGFLFIFIYCKGNIWGLNGKKYIIKSLVLLAFLLLFDISAHVLYAFSHPELRYLTYLKRRLENRVFGTNHLLALPLYANFHNGAVKSLLIEGVQSLEGNITLSKDQIHSIERELDKSRTTLVNAKPIDVQNVIFILVESYMSFVTDMVVDGQEVTPNLNALKKDSTVYFNGKVQSNITMGESADGQYIYMTGLLPLRSMITVSKASEKPLPSLPKSLKKHGIVHSRMVLPTSSALWRQDVMCRQYGFDSLYASNNFPGEHKQTLTDEQVFEYAKTIDETSPDHFFSIVLTASMHQPYDKILDSTFVVNDPSINHELAYYLNACHYTDREIGNYLDFLKTTGLYNKSLIVITADHHVHHTDFGGGIAHDIPLFIVNGGIGNNAYRGPCNQVDIYTTLMDLFAIKDGWIGLGSSLLNTIYTNSVTDKRWDIAEWLLLSDYFRM